MGKPRKKKAKNYSYRKEIIDDKIKFCIYKSSCEQISCHESETHASIKTKYLNRNLYLNNNFDYKRIIGDITTCHYSYHTNGEIKKVLKNKKFGTKLIGYRTYDLENNLICFFEKLDDAMKSMGDPIESSKQEPIQITETKDFDFFDYDSRNITEN